MAAMAAMAQLQLQLWLWLWLWLWLQLWLQPMAVAGCGLGGDFNNGGTLITGAVGYFFTFFGVNLGPGGPGVDPDTSGSPRAFD